MQAYILRRLLALVPTLLFASLIVFFSIRLIPGDVIDMMLAQNDISTGQDRARIEAALGLDQPIHTQYFRWLYGVVQGDLGRSLLRNTDVAEQLWARLPVTFELGFLALVVALSVAIPIGIYSAMRQDTIGDYLTRSFSLVMLAVPGFWIGTLVMVFPSVWWRWSPPIEYVPFFEGPAKNLSHLLVPAILLGLSLSAVTMRMTRTMMLEVMRQDYIRTARAKGLPERKIFLKHALKNGITPVLSYSGPMAAAIITGSIVIEKIFHINGLGQHFVDAALARDYSVVMATVLIYSSLVVLFNLLVDVGYALIDPRVRPN